MTQPPDEKPPTLWQTVQSVGASFFGVQSRKNRERDFKRGNPALFIGVALGATLVFVLLVILAVKLALKNAGM